MATYQYHLTFIPRQSILRHWDNVPIKIQVHDNPLFDEDDLINVKWWNKETVDFNVIEKRILNFADQVEWTKLYKDQKTFGDNETNDIDIGRNERGQFDGMSCRIDLSNMDWSFVDQVINIAKDLDCLLLDRQGNLFEPTRESLIENSRKSNAFKFVTNPTDFLNGLGKTIEME